MKTLLVAVNASFSHTSLAVRALTEYVKKYNSPESEISFLEFTINQLPLEILRGIAEENPDLIMFSTYIWNAEYVQNLIPNIKKILPDAIIGAGGPEFGYAAELYLNKIPNLDFIVYGEGERILSNLIKKLENFFPKIEKLTEVPGIFIRSPQNPQKIIFTGEQELICDLAELPFAYPELVKYNQGTLTQEQQQYLFNKIYYYETNRGCPYSCTYCMSSLDKKVRFMPLERVYQDLQIFLDAKIPLVKFVDRTYNLQTQRYIAIWQYILEHHNGITMFHFEIEAEYLSEDALKFLQKVPGGIMQFEIGVQSANPKTLQTVCRSPNVEKLAQNVRQIPRTIHQHLDLIAGLPFENLESFGQSFDFVMNLKPDALQLGFLKVLHGTKMEEYAKKNGWKWMENPAYETLSTPYLSYSDMLFLKDLEVLLDAYWNSGKFPHIMNYLGRNTSWWIFFSNFTKWCQQNKVFQVARRETYWFELLAEYIKEGEASPCLQPAQPKAEPSYATPSAGQLPQNSAPQRPNILYELLRYDFVLRGKQGGWPDWYKHHYNKEKHRELLEQNGGIKNARLDFAHSEYEEFQCNVDSVTPEQEIGLYEKLIKY